MSEYEIPKGFNVKTEGLSIRFGESESHNLAILDSAGQETPLLKEENKNLKEEDKYLFKACFLPEVAFNFIIKFLMF